jgi:hypothetical protein
MAALISFSIFGKKVEAVLVAEKRDFFIGAGILSPCTQNANLLRLSKFVKALDYQHKPWVLCFYCFLEKL